MRRHFFFACVAFLWLAASGPAALAATATTTRLVPNDAFYAKEWGMNFIHAPEAWARLATERPAVAASKSVVAKADQTPVVVAIIDAGVDETHPDLKGALWTNPDEKKNGKDDDNDGLIDDLHGWNFVTGNGDTRPVGNAIAVSRAAWEHGTAVASVIAGRGNDGIGVAGLSWSAKIMPLVILGSDGSGGTDRLADAIRYAVAHRADIINLSIEGTEDDPDVDLAIREATAKGVLVVIAAGNGENGAGTNLDAKPLYPSCSTGAAGQGVLVVTAVGEDGRRNSTSNFGACANIAAPGVGIFAARPTYDVKGGKTNVTGYGTWGGTSLAAPFVSGVAVLLKQQHPEWSGEQLARRILDTVQSFPLPEAAKGLGKGIVDAAAAMAPADARTYGPWELFASAPGGPPRAWVTDRSGKILFTIPAGDPADRRGLRASFVQWDGDRVPDVLVTARGDADGAWRVYRTDGVLLAADKMLDVVKGGLLIGTQDVDANGVGRILMTEAEGKRVWFMIPGTATIRAVTGTDAGNVFGTVAVGIQRPVQAFLALVRSEKSPHIRVLERNGWTGQTSVRAVDFKKLSIEQAVTADGRELVRIMQSGSAAYLIERNGMLQTDPKAVPFQWRQAPLGLTVSGLKDRSFFDFWPR